MDLSTEELTAEEHKKLAYCNSRRSYRSKTESFMSGKKIDRTVGSATKARLSAISFMDFRCRTSTLPTSEFNLICDCDSGLVVEFQGHGSVCGRSSCAQCGSDQRALGDFLTRGPGGLCGFYVYFNAIRTLRRKSNTQCDQLAIFPWNRAAVTANDLVQVEPRIEFRGREFAHFLEKPQIPDIMIMIAHSAS